MKTGLLSVYFRLGRDSRPTDRGTGRVVLGRENNKIFRLRQEDSKKGVKLMTADSNYEIRLLGAKVILNMAQQTTTQTKERLWNSGRPAPWWSRLDMNEWCPKISNKHKKSFLEMVILSSAKEKNLEIKSIYNLGKFSFAKKIIVRINRFCIPILTWNFPIMRHPLYPGEYYH